jgi:DNA-binding XRE family transcriptional regulator
MVCKAVICSAGTKLLKVCGEFSMSASIHPVMRPAFQREGMDGSRLAPLATTMRRGKARTFFWYKHKPSIRTLSRIFQWNIIDIIEVVAIDKQRSFRYHWHIFEYSWKRVRSVSTFKQLREEAGLTVQALASEAGVSLSTVNRMEYGTTQVTRRIAYQVLNVISSKIGRRITIEEVKGLQVKT